MIATERLLLRRFSPADADDLLALQADREVSRFIPLPEPYERPQVLERLQRDRAAWESGHRSLAIEERASGRFQGRVTFYEWAHLDETELGWALRADARRRGFATEAALAYLAWGFRNLQAPYFTSMIRRDNTPSIRVAERLGMTPMRVEESAEPSMIVYAIRRDEWRREDA